MDLLFNLIFKYLCELIEGGMVLSLHEVGHWKWEWLINASKIQHHAMSFTNRSLLFMIAQYGWNKEVHGKYKNLDDSKLQYRFKSYTNKSILTHTLTLVIGMIYICYLLGNCSTFLFLSFRSICHWIYNNKTKE